MFVDEDDEEGDGFLPVYDMFVYDMSVYQTTYRNGRKKWIDRDQECGAAASVPTRENHGQSVGVHSPEGRATTHLQS